MQRSNIYFSDNKRKLGKHISVRYLSKIETKTVSVMIYTMRSCEEAVSHLWGQETSTGEPRNFGKVTDRLQLTYNLCIYPQIVKT